MSGRRPPRHPSPGPISETKETPRSRSSGQYRPLGISRHPDTLYTTVLENAELCFHQANQRKITFYSSESFPTARADPPQSLYLGRSSSKENQTKSKLHESSALLPSANSPRDTPRRREPASPVAVNTRTPAPWALTGQRVDGRPHYTRAETYPWRQAPQKTQDGRVSGMSDTRQAIRGPK